MVRSVRSAAAPARGAVGTGPAHPHRNKLLENQWSSDVALMRLRRVESGGPGQEPLGSWRAGAAAPGRAVPVCEAACPSIHPHPCAAAAGSEGRSPVSHLGVDKLSPMGA